MTRRNAVCLIVAMLCIAFAPASHAADSSAGKDELTKFVWENEDAHMNADDLAFFLVTHDFDARPKDDYVIVKIDDVTYKLVPNADKPGLADVTEIS